MTYNINTHTQSYYPAPSWLLRQDYYRDFPLKEMIKWFTSAAGGQNSTLYLKYSITSNTHIKWTFFQLELPTRWKKDGGSGKTGRQAGRGGKGRCLEGWFAFLRTSTDASVGGNTVGAQLARVHAEDLIICHIIRRSSTRGRTDPAECLVNIFRGCWCAQRGTFTLIPLRRWVLSGLWSGRVDASKCLIWVRTCRR